MIDVNRLSLEGQGELMEMLRTVVDPRKPRGVRHPAVTVVAIAICAALSGAPGFNAIAKWGKDLSRDTLRQLGSKRWKPPSEPTIRRVLQHLDAQALGAKIGPWLLAHGSGQSRAVSVDGKTLKRAHDAGQKPPHLLSAVLHQSNGAEGFHLRALPELDVSLSTHPAPIVQPRRQVANAEAGLSGAISTVPANPRPALHAS